MPPESPDIQESMGTNSTTNEKYSLTESGENTEQESDETLWPIKPIAHKLESEARESKQKPDSYENKDRIYKQQETFKKGQVKPSTPSAQTPNLPDPKSQLQGMDQDK